MCWLLLLDVIFVKFTRVVVHRLLSLLYSIPLYDRAHIALTHAAISGHLGSCSFEAITNTVALSLLTLSFGRRVRTHVCWAYS